MLSILPDTPSTSGHGLSRFMSPALFQEPLMLPPAGQKVTDMDIQKLQEKQDYYNFQLGQAIVGTLWICFVHL